MIILSKMNPLIPLFTPPTPFFTSSPPTIPTCFPPAHWMSSLALIIARGWVTRRMAEMPKPDNHLFCVSFAIIAIEKWFCTGATDPGGCGRAQREVENKSVIRQATESDVGGQQRAAIQPATVQFLPWTWGKNPNETEENKTARCPQIRKQLRGSTEEEKKSMY